MQRTLILVWLLCLLLTACQSATPIPAFITVSANSGLIEVQANGQGSYYPLLTGQKVSPGDRIRSAAESGVFVEFKDARSLIAMGPGSMMVVAALSTNPDLTETRLQLEEGGVYVSAEQPLGKGYLEVATPGGAARLSGSSMMVALDKTAQQTDVTCTSGSAVVQANGSSVSLMADQSTGFTSSSVPTRPEDLDGRIRRKYPQFQEIIDDRYWRPKVMTDPTITPENSPTVRPTSTAAPTALATWTPFVLGPTSTARVDSAVPTRRPTTTVVPGFSGLTPEELANQGAFTYAIACQAWNGCVCDSANANPVQTITITFDTQGVTLAGSVDETLAYPKAAPNLYSLESPELTADITFLMEGFEFFVVRGGQVCQLQTFTRQP